MPELRNGTATLRITDKKLRVETTTEPTAVAAGTFRLSDVIDMIARDKDGLWLMSAAIRHRIADIDKQLRELQQERASLHSATVPSGVDGSDDTHCVPDHDPRCFGHGND